MAFGMNFFRKYQGRLLLVVVVLLMVTWFIGGALMRLLTPASAAGMMFGERVSTVDFSDARIILTTLRLGTAPADTDIWRFLVLQHEADRLGIPRPKEAGNQDVVGWIKASMGVQDKDVNAVYQWILTTGRVSDGQFRYALAQELRVSRLIEMVAGAALPTDEEAWKLYVKEELKVKLRTLRVTTEEMKSKVAKPDEAQLAAFYGTKKAAYKEPAKATVEYIAALKKDYAKLVPVSDEEVRDYYEKNKTEEFLLPPAASTASEVASPASGSTASEIGSSTSAAASPAAEAVAGATPAEASPAGSTASEVARAGSTASETAAEESIYKPFSQVAGEIRDKLMAQKADGLISDAQVDAARDKSLTLKQVADNYGLPYFQVGPISRGHEDELAGLAAAATGERTSAVDAIFSGTTTGEAEIAKGPEGSFLFRVSAFEPEREPPLAEVKDAVEADYVKAEAEKLAMAEAGKMLEQLKTAGWGEYETNPRYDVTDTSLTRELKFPALFDAATTVDKGAFGGPVLGPDGAYAFQVMERKEPDARGFEGAKLILKYQAMGGMSTSFRRHWEDELVKSAKVEQFQAAAGEPSRAPISPYYY